MKTYIDILDGEHFLDFLDDHNIFGITISTWEERVDYYSTVLGYLHYILYSVEYHDDNLDEESLNNLILLIVKYGSLENAYFDED